MNQYVILGWLVGWIVLAVCVGNYAETRGHNALLYTVVSLVLSPLVGLALVLSEGHATKPRQPHASGASPDRLDHLQKLNELRAADALTDEEFESEKARILSS